jgi:signal transduction histidine kinase
LAKQPEKLHTLPSLQGPRVGFIRLKVLSNRHLPQLCVMIFQDVTELRQSQAERDLAVQFLSHDLRAPIASILSLLDAPLGATPQHELDAVRLRIQRHARQLLEGMDGFLLHHRAHRTLSLEDHLLDDLISEALIQVRDMASQRGMALVLEAGPESSIIKMGYHIEPNVQSLSGANQRWVRVWVRNAMSKGVAEAQLNDPEPPLSPPAPTIRSFGLGLTFVAQVMAQHKGHLLRDIPDAQLHQDAPTQWACVSLVMPCEIEPWPGS